MIANARIDRARLAALARGAVEPLQVERAWIARPERAQPLRGVSVVAQLAQRLDRQHLALGSEQAVGKARAVLVEHTQCQLGLLADQRSRLVQQLKLRARSRARWL